MPEGVVGKQLDRHVLIGSTNQDVLNEFDRGAVEKLEGRRLQKAASRTKLRFVASWVRLTILIATLPKMLAIHGQRDVE